MINIPKTAITLPDGAPPLLLSPVRRTIVAVLVNGPLAIRALADATRWGTEAVRSQIHVIAGSQLVELDCQQDGHLRNVAALDWSRFVEEVAQLTPFRDYFDQLLEGRRADRSEPPAEVSVRPQCWSQIFAARHRLVVFTQIALARPDWFSARDLEATTGILQSSVMHELRRLHQMGALECTSAYPCRFRTTGAIVRQLRDQVDAFLRLAEKQGER